MIEGKYYIDSDGYPWADFSPPYETLGVFLVSDVQSCAETCDIVLSECDAILSGKEQRISGTGNAHTVTMTREGVLIENEYTDELPPCRLSIEEFRQVIESWKKLITGLPPR